MFDFDGTKIYWLGHDGFKIITSDDSNLMKTVYIDPYELSSAHKNKKDADLVLLTHDHYDHLSAEDLKNIVNSNTRIVAAHKCINKLKAEGIKVLELKGVMPGDSILIGNFSVEAVPAYNTNKKFHPKEDNHVGFVITVNGGKHRIYHTGDTDIIPEMQLVKPDIAFIPVSGTYVMTAREAAQAVNELVKPKGLAIPMHYGTIVGSEKDAETFKELVNVCKVDILGKD